MPRVWTAKGQRVALGIVITLLLASLVVLNAPSSPKATGLPQALTSSRDPYLWPFSPDSIWNLPIGAGAVYVSAQVKRATAYGMTTDPDVLILTPSAPNTSVDQNNDGWSGGSRCTPQGGVLFNAPIPSDFIVPGAGSGNPDGTTPNYAAAILLSDNHTLAQGQPMARCTAGGPATMMWYQENEDLYGLGFSGAHGGSMLSSIGGTIRLGELVPGGAIRHTLKVNLYGADDYFYNASTKGYRWPATTADSYAAGNYGGTVPALRMGSLLALSPNINITSMGLETQPALILARAFQDYGAYTVDDTGWSVYAIETEFGPSGHVEDQFQSAWGFSMRPSSKNTPWARDMDRIFGNLSVVDNWNKALWQNVSQSNGTEGAGGGAPRVPWAPPFGTPPPPPPPPALNADFTFTPSYPETGQTVSFAASATGGTPPYRFAWTFGDGSSGSGANVGHTYSSPGTYTVNLAVTDSNAVTATASKQVAVTAPPLAADFTFNPADPITNQSINFDANVSGGTLPYAYAWTYGDGSTGTGASASHAYAGPGNYTATLKVTDAASQTESRSKTVAVAAPPTPPPPPPPGTDQVTVQRPAAGLVVNPGQQVTVSWMSSGSLQAGSASLSFSSDGGATWDAPFATGQPLNGSATWTAPNMTTDHAMLRVAVQATNGSVVEGRSGLFMIEAPAPPPVVPGNPVARMTYGPGWPTPGESVTFDGSSSSPSEANLALQARWDWTDDGTWDTGWSSTLTANHAYAGQGRYTARLEVRDASGGTDNATATIVVDGTPPTTTASVSGTLGKRGWFTSLAKVAFSAADAMSGVASTWIRVDGGNWQDYTGPLFLDSGRHKVGYYSEDRAGETETVRTVKVNVDRSPPVFHVVSPTGVVSTSPVFVSWNATNEPGAPINYSTSVDGAAFVATGPIPSISENLADGEHTIVVNATSDSGLSSATTFSFRVDTNAFSFTGPYFGIPTILLVVGFLVVAFTASHHHRAQARRRRERVRALSRAR